MATEKKSVKSTPKKKETKEERALRERDEFAVKEVSKALAERVLYIVDGGLSDGLGDPIRGEMCVEAAVCYAMGDRHNDEPKCVHDDVRSAKIQLNDKGWSNNKARAKGMRRIAVAQLGSNKIDGHLFIDTFGESLIKDILIPELKAHAQKKNDTAAIKFLNRVAKEKETDVRVNMFSDFPEDGDENHMYACNGAYESLTAVVSEMNSYPNPEGLIDGMGDWISGAKSANKKNERLTRIADCIEKALVKCKSEGRKWLSLCKN